MLRGGGGGGAAGFGRIASVLAPLAVPPLVAAGGTATVFAVFTVAFALAIAGSLFLPELRGRVLADTLAEEGG